MNRHIRRDHGELLRDLVGGRLPRNLSWSSVTDLIGQIGEVQPHGNDEYVFAVGSQRCFFKRPSAHNLAVGEISRLRRFLKEAGVLGIPVKAHQIGRMAVAIDHHVAHIYYDLGGSRPDPDVTVRPYEPFGFHHHLIHRKEAHYEGDRVPEEDPYLRRDRQGPCARRSDHCNRTCYGKSSAVGFLTELLKGHHPEQFQRIVATETADLSALTEPQIEEIAKRNIGNTVETPSTQL